MNLYNTDEPPLVEIEDEPPGKIPFIENSGESDGVIRMVSRSVWSHFLLHGGLPKHGVRRYCVGNIIYD